MEKKQQGFAVMDKELHRKIAVMGGKATQASGRAYRWNSKTAAAAGRKGGRKVSQDRKHMAEIGRLGGRS